MKGIRSVVFDTTGTGYLKMRKKAQPSKQAINKALAKMKVKVKKLELVELPKKTSKYEITITGVS
jgi:uncharacterized membrane protein YkoI